MLKFKLLNLSVANVVFRFYAMMAVVIICGFMNQWVLGALLAFGLAMSTILGVSFGLKKEESVVVYEKANKVVQMKNTERMRQAS